MIYFIASLLIVFTVAIIVCVHEASFERRTVERKNAVDNLFIARKRERYRTHVIDHGHHAIIGDGAWAPTARIRDLPKARGI